MRFLVPLCLSGFSLAAARIPDQVIPADICPPRDITTLLATTPYTTTCPLPIHGPLGPETRSPWTHHPRCTITASAQTYCVFTSSPFGAHGLSLIASPEAAASLSPILAHIHHSSFPSTASARNLNLETAFEVRELPGKDKGLVATRLIRERETFLLDHASLVVSDGFPLGTDREERVAALQEAVDRLVDPGAVRGLSRVGKSGDLVEDVVESNAFTSELDIGRSYVLFPLISRVNHACKPNAFIRHASHGLLAGIAAFRDIQPGEEITISYIPLQEPSLNRQSLLRKNWNFTCICPLCSSPPQILANDDIRRKELQEWEAEAISAIHSRDFPVAIERLTELAEGFMGEGLWPLLQDIYQVLATLYNAMGRREDAVGYLEKKLDVKDDYGRLEVVDRGVSLEEEMRGLGMVL